MIKLVISGGIWVLIRQFIVRLISIIQLIVLAWYLSPSQIGLFSIALMVQLLIESLSQLGFNQSLIQQRTVLNEDLNTLFVVNLIRGVLLFLLTLALSFPVSLFMNEPRSINLILLISLYPILKCLHNPAFFMLNKKLDQKKELPFYIFGSISNFISSLYLAINNFGAISLVVGLLVQSLCQLILSYKAYPFKPKLEYSKKSFQRMFKFGKWMLISQGIKYFSNNSPIWVIGNMLGVNSLGNFHIASRSSQAIGNEFISVISTVTFPTFSILNNDVFKLQKVYLRSQKIILSVSFYIFAIMFIFSEPFVNIFFGKDWLSSVVLMKLFSVIGLIQSIGSQVEILKAINKPEIIVKYSIIRLIMVLVSIYFFTKYYGESGALLSVLLPILLTTIPLMYNIFKLIEIIPRDYLRILLPPSVSYLVVLCFSTIFEFGKYENPLIILSLIILTSIIYLIKLYFLDIILKSTIYNEWNNIMNSIFKGVT